MQSLQEHPGLRSTRILRLDLTNEQIDLLVSYAMRNGFQRKYPNGSWGLSEQNQAAKWAILSRLGFN